MRLRLRHTTHYRYSERVHLEPHILRLRPRMTPWHVLERFRFQVTPQPAGMADWLDSSGNFVTSMWFGAPLTQVTIVAESQLQLLPYNPFDFLLHPAQSARLPFAYNPQVTGALQPYLEPRQMHGPIREVADALQRDSGQDTIGFITGLNARIYEVCERVIREEGDPFPPELTWGERRGSCRDFAMLFVAVCRAAGIAARFVSGYSMDERENEDRELHAWAEVYLPGAGWRGFDPSEGVAVTERHIAVAAAPTHVLAAPVTGTFRGGGHSIGPEGRIEVVTLD